MLRDRRWPQFIRSVEIFTDERQVQLNVIETDQPVAKRFFEWCGETIAGLVGSTLDYEERFRVGRNSFFQVNRFLVDRLVETAIEGAEGGAALDVYAGVGLFSLALARKFGQVTAVESGASAVRDLEFNAERAGLSNVKAIQKSAEEYLAALEEAPDFVLVDPPRAGLGKAVVARLAELRPRQLTVVACDAATLARDLAGLIGAGYRMERLTLVDLFPQTMHLETVVQLRSDG
jgi:23S rRNA (uracil1939-C5)-methyltransferase